MKTKTHLTCVLDCHVIVKNVLPIFPMQISKFSDSLESLFWLKLKMNWGFLARKTFRKADSRLKLKPTEGERALRIEILQLPNVSPRTELKKVKSSKKKKSLEIQGPKSRKAEGSIRHWFLDIYTAFDFQLK